MDAFVARQPIFTRDLSVYGYELLFRSSLDNVYSSRDPDQASAKVMVDSCSVFGLEVITDRKPAFINATRDTLLGEYLHLLPPDMTVVEILEDVEPDPAIVKACKAIKEAGFLLALDDFVYREEFKPLLELADIIKIDVLATSEEDQRSLIEQRSHTSVRFLAEKVETQEMFEATAKMGYSLFQGYFFSKPAVLTRKDIPASKVNYLRILKEVKRPELDFEQVEEIIRQDLSLAYKFLRYINSAHFAWRSKVNSIGRALILLGENQTKKWIYLASLACMADDKPEELMVQAIVRAKFCESMAAKVRGLNDRSEDLFLMGLFSLLDAMLDRSLPELMDELPIAEDIKQALTAGQNPLRDVYEYVLAYERGDWATVSDQATSLDLIEPVTPRTYEEAVEWAADAMDKRLATAGSAR